MKVGNIVVSGNPEMNSNFNVVNHMEDIIEGLPTIVASYEYVRDNYDDYDITNKQLDNNLYWTFAKIERRDDHYKDIEEFITLSYQKLIKGVAYVSIDPIHYKSKQIKKILQKIKSSSNNVAYKYNDMVYLYSDNVIFGIDLKLMKFIGLDMVKLERKIKSICSEFLDSSEILIEYKDCIERLDNSVKYVPYLHSISNE